MFASEAQNSNMTSFMKKSVQHARQKIFLSSQSHGGNVLKVRFDCLIIIVLFQEIEFVIAAKFCPLPPPMPEDDVTVVVKHSGLRYGTVCPGTNGYDPLPINGCEGNQIKLGPLVPKERTESSAKYDWMIDRDQGGTLVLLLVFTQPMDSSKISLPDDIIVTDLPNPTDILIEISLPETSPILKFEVELLWTAGEQEPCFIDGVCQVVLNNQPTDEIKQLMLDFPFDYRNITTYHSLLEYSCSLAKEFLLNDATGETSPTIEKTCSWDQNWEPNDEIPPCVCKSFIHAFKTAF